MLINLLILRSSPLLLFWDEGKGRREGGYTHLAVLFHEARLLGPGLDASLYHRRPSLELLLAFGGLEGVVALLLDLGVEGGAEGEQEKKGGRERVDAYVRDVVTDMAGEEGEKRERVDVT